RRAQTSIYNVEPDVFAEVLAEVVDRSALEWLPSGPRRLLLRFREPPIDPILVPQGSPAAGASAFGEYTRPQSSASPAQGTSLPAAPWAVLTVEPFPALRHVTLNWRGHDEAIRLEVETQLAMALAQRRSRHNPVGGWFLSLAIGLFLSATFALLVLW